MSSITSDINEHLPTLCRYAQECDSVFETGVRGCISSWALTYGLLNNKNETQKTLLLNDQKNIYQRIKHGKLRRIIYKSHFKMGI